MQITRSKTQYLHSTILILATLFVWVISSSGMATAGYADSAHGNTSYGVNRSTSACTKWPGGVCTTGSCAHCHDTFDPNICGQAGHPEMLFAANDNDFCLKCHENTTNYATTPIVNRSYSFRAGGYSIDPVDDIREAFSSTSSHSLDDITTFTSGKWGYTVDSNPCNACHNQHLAQGDPENAPNDAKSSSTRGWPLSRPSEHNSGVWPLWGDDSTERMNAYSTNYKAPYRYGSTSAYEPDGSTTTNGSNLSDFNTFCTDCHNTTYTIYSTSLGRNLRQIDWDAEIHGKGVGSGILYPQDPYDSSTTVLSCTDCHEPHGSPNAFLLRMEVNGAVLDNPITAFSLGPCSLYLYSGCYKYSTNENKELGWLCKRCHQDDADIDNFGIADQWKYSHHYNDPLKPYKRTRCYRCHPTSSGEPISCNCCHYHGSQTTDYGDDYPCNCDSLICNEPIDRRTF